MLELYNCTLGRMRWNFLNVPWGGCAGTFLMYPGADALDLKVAATVGAPAALPCVPSFHIYIIIIAR